MVVSLNSGDNVTCTFTNTEYGSVTIVKQAVTETPADQGQDFSFFSCGALRARRRHRPDPFQQPESGICSRANTTSWRALACRAGASLASLHARRHCRPQERDADIDLVAGADVTCTFTNTQSQATLTIVKDAFAERAAGLQVHHDRRRPQNFSLDDDTEPTLSNSVSSPT